VRRAALPALLSLILVAPAGGATGQGLYGLVTRGPTRPVCSVGEPCSEPAARTKLRFLRGGALVGSVVTDARGRYRLRLPGGLYTVRTGAAGSASGIGRGVEPSTVRVRAGWRRQNFDVDTGIR
jgi:hypothetical protein